jgi:uncharacterized SAM-binding protein YcdF (DUF218 family)
MTGGRSLVDRGDGRTADAAEADVHAGSLAAAGVPADAIIVERRSATTLENVLLASGYGWTRAG